MSDISPPFDALWFKALWGFLVGTVLGSFITMLSYRLPQRLSIIKPGSFCPTCRAPLGVRDLVPVASWFVSGGACRHCGVKISARYPLIEMASGACSALAFAWVGFQPLLVIVLAIIVAAISYITIQIEKN